MSSTTPSNIPSVETVDLKGFTREQMEALVAQLRGENKTLRAAEATGAAPGLTLKIGEKGGVSLYGLGKFPVTLHVTQWDALFHAEEAVKGFIAKHRHLCASKGVAYVRSAEAAAVKVSVKRA